MDNYVWPLMHNIIPVCAVLFLVSRTAMFGQAGVDNRTNAGNSVTTRPQTLSALTCDKCAVTNVSGIVPDHKLIAPVLSANSSDAGSSNTPPLFQASPTNLQKAGINNPAALVSTNWMQIPFAERTAVTPLPRINGAVAYDEARGLAVVFGGRHYELVNGNWTISDLGDTWTWDGRTWMQQHPTNKPPPRSFTTMAYYPGVGKIVLFGGWCLSCGTYLNDTWEWDGVTGLKSTRQPHRLRASARRCLMTLRTTSSFSSADKL